jgi:hypothetical protein
MDLIAIKVTAASIAMILAILQGLIWYLYMWLARGIRPSY